MQHATIQRLPNPKVIFQRREITLKGIKEI